MSLLVGPIIGAAATLITQIAVRKLKDSGLADRSTTSSAGGGAAAYETKKAVDEYIQFHFGEPQDLLPYPNGPKEALAFTARLAQLCERHCAALQDFTGESAEPVAMDMGCAVGGAAFELARAFPHVLGIDYSHAFIDAAKEMQRTGSWQYEAVVEGETRAKYTARVADDIDRNRVRFMQGDACDLPADLSQFDCVLAANLLCRLPEPIKFLERCRTLIKPGGVLVLVSPYSWLKGWTAKDKWLGGYDKDGKPVRTRDTITAILSPDFELVDQADVPFLIREHARKFQWGCSHAMVWRRKGGAPVQAAAAAAAAAPVAAAPAQAAAPAPAAAAAPAASSSTAAAPAAAAEKPAAGVNPAAAGAAPSQAAAAPAPAAAATGAVASKPAAATAAAPAAAASAAATKATDAVKKP